MRRRSKTKWFLVSERVKGVDGDDDGFDPQMDGGKTKNK